MPRATVTDVQSLPAVLTVEQVQQMYATTGGKS